MPGFGANTSARATFRNTHTSDYNLMFIYANRDAVCRPATRIYLAPSNTCVFACLVPVRKYSALGCVDKAGSWSCVHTYAPRNLFSYIHIIFVLNRAHRRRQSLGFMGFRGFMLDLSLLVDPR